MSIKGIFLRLLGFRFKYYGNDLAYVKVPRFMNDENTIKKLQLRLLGSGIILKRVENTRTFRAERIF
jgi:hypothetical protein